MKALLLVAALLSSSWANTCLENGKDVLPRNIGRPGSDLFNLYVLECDTVYVRQGDTSSVNTATRLVFHKKILPTKRTIVVDGVLIIAGEIGKNILVSGSITEGAFGMVPSDEPWNGFRIGSTGSIRVAHAVISNADTVIQAQSSRVILDKTSFIGCSQIETPSRSLTLDSRLTSIHFEDFTPTPLPNFSTPIEIPGEQPAPVVHKSSSLKFWLIGSGLALALAGATVATAVLLDDSNPGPEPNLILTVPDFPPDGSSR